MTAEYADGPHAMIAPERRTGRGAATNRSGRFEAQARVAVDDGWGALETAEALAPLGCAALGALSNAVTRSDLCFRETIKTHGCRDLLHAASEALLDNKHRLSAGGLALLTAVLTFAAAVAGRDEGRVYLVKSANAVRVCCTALQRCNRAVAVTAAYMALRCAAVALLRACGHAATNSSHFLSEGT